MDRLSERLNISYITNSVFNSRTYILSEDGSDSVWLVDCGDFEPILENIGSKSIEGVLLTHAHFDHIYGLPLLIEEFANVAIYTNQWGKLALADERLNMSRYHDLPIRVDADNVRVVKEGDIVRGFYICETPGHNPSCMCFVNKEVMFTGDAYIPGCKVVTNLPNSNKALAEESLTRLNQLLENRIVYPGHTI